MIVPSADISEFNIIVRYNLSGVTPTICIQADSVGPNEALVEYIYKITTPSGAIVWEGSFTSPDATGNAAIFCKDLPLFNGAIEWSGTDFTVVATMKDTAALEFSQTQTAQICPPRGNSVAGSNYGQSCINVQVKCDTAEVLLSDCTNYDYKGYVKTLVSKTITLIFPPDADGTTPAPVVLTGFYDVAIPITANGNYEVRLETIYTYTIDGSNTVTILYTTYNQVTGTHKPFVVECYIDLCPLLCEYTEFLAETEALCGKNEVKYVENNRILSLINGKILLVMMNKDCGKPVGSLINQIKAISGFKCNCDCGNNGVNRRTLIRTSSAGTFSFAVATSCGDVGGVWTNPSGNNYLLTLNDVQYVFALTAGATTAGFSVANTTAGCVKTYRLDIDLETFADTILNTINSDVTLKALLCSIVTACDFPDVFTGVDMKCITDALISECDYYGELLSPNTPLDTFKGIQVNGVWYYPSITYLYDNAVQINLWLQTLGFGFGATDYIIGGSGNVAFTSLANINNVTRLAFTNVTTTNVYTINISPSNCTTGTSSDKMQGVVDKICSIYDALYGVSSILYKVKTDSSDTSPDFLDQKISSSDGSVQVTVIGDQLDLKTTLKVNAADTCPGYLINKIKSDDLVVTNEIVAITAYDYVITNGAIGPTRYVASIAIDGVDYGINVLTTDLVGLASALNALGLGTFTCTSPASNLVITSLGNVFVVQSIVVENTVGPTYTTVNAVQSNPTSAGYCAKVNIDPIARTWTPITVDPLLFDSGTSLVEYTNVDSFGNVMLNILVDPLVSPLLAGTHVISLTDPLPFPPRTAQKVPFWYGWSGAANLENYFLIQTNGIINIVINITQGSQEIRKDSIIYPTN